MRHMRLKVISGYYRTLKWSFSRSIVSPCYDAANLLKSCRLSSRAVIRVRNAHLKHLISFRLDRFNLACRAKWLLGSELNSKLFMISREFLESLSTVMDSRKFPRILEFISYKFPTSGVFLWNISVILNCSLVFQLLPLTSPSRVSPWLA